MMGAFLNVNTHLSRNLASMVHGSALASAGEPGVAPRCAPWNNAQITNKLYFIKSVCTMMYKIAFQESRDHTRARDVNCLVTFGYGYTFLVFLRQWIRVR